jgi:hypothetical protein
MTRRYCSGPLVTPCEHCGTPLAWDPEVGFYCVDCWRWSLVDPVPSLKDGEG